MCLRETSPQRLKHRKGVNHVTDRAKLDNEDSLIHNGIR
jgi:hypothetical protein